MFSSLDWVPTFVEIAGGPKGEELNKQIMAGKYEGIVKTKLDGFNQLDYLTGKVGKVESRHVLLLPGPRPLGRALQELEVLLHHDGFHRRLGARAAHDVSTGLRSRTSCAIRSRITSGQEQKGAFSIGGALASPSTAYLYDWNLLPIGQLLWEKELMSYIDFPPLQMAASYNLEQVLEQVREMGKRHPSQ